MILLNDKMEEIKISTSISSPQSHHRHYPLIPLIPTFRMGVIIVLMIISSSFQLFTTATETSTTFPKTQKYLVQEQLLNLNSNQTWSRNVNLRLSSLSTISPEEEKADADHNPFLGQGESKNNSEASAAGAIEFIPILEIRPQQSQNYLKNVPLNEREEEKVRLEKVDDWGNGRVRRNDLITATCPMGHFACASDTSLCVPQNAICNGKPDCPEGSDESDCENKHDKTFWDTFFQKRPGADVGKNDTCKYPIVKSGFGESLQGCLCSGEKLFCHNLHNLNLSMIPEKVEFLDLSGSEVDFKENGARFHHLHTLILSSTNLKEIGPDNFGSLSLLQILHLTGNNLKSIPSGTFGLNVKLKKLYLGYNSITILDPDSFKGLSQLEELDLRHNKLKFTPTTSYFVGLTSLRILHLSNNDLETLGGGDFHGLESLEMLSLTRNRISSIGRDTFANLTTLIHLYLSYNRLESLEQDTFCNLGSLLNLNLNNNGIKRISPTSFACLDSLQSLVLEQNKFGELENPSQIFANLTQLQHIYFDQFWMCAWAPHVRSCEPKGDGISSVENLLDNVVLRVCVWIMGLVGVIGNGFVILSRLLVREKNRVHSFYIKNLALADLLMGSFLLSIAYHDVIFRGHFLANQHSWRHSLTCQWSGLLSTLSSESSVLILTLITLDRYLSIVKPFSERRNAMFPAISVILVLWSVSFLLSAAPLSPMFEEYFGLHFYTSNGLCLPLNIHNPFDAGWEYSFFLFVLINSVAFAFICFAYWRMLRIIQMSTTSIRSTQQSQDGLLAMRFGIVVLTDFLCWAPVILSKAVAMSGVAIQSDFYAWLAVFVLPVNSALNPILYTLTTKLFKQQVSNLTLGVRKRLGMATEDSATSSMYYRNRISRTLNTSLSGSMMHSTTSTKRGGGGGAGVIGVTSGNGSLVTRHQARNRNRYTISAINSVIASSTGIQLPGDSAAATNSSGFSDGGDPTYPNGGGSGQGQSQGHPFSLQTLEEGVELNSQPPAHFTDIDLNSQHHEEGGIAETVT